MNKQEIISRVETLMNVIANVDIPQRLMPSTGATLQNVIRELQTVGRAIMEMPEAKDEKTEE